ncbi:MAG: hypothetical protein B6I31_03225 [Desulfobacteraceae bacterium 4572_19]|nr:MAG: hypothetical protein B6I31_03225 [Desulfobacteraceae bacterium 4572_19]
MCSRTSGTRGYFFSGLVEATSLVCAPGLQAQEVISFVPDPVSLLMPDFLPMPENYSHDLYECRNETAKHPVAIRASSRVLRQLYDGIENSSVFIESCACEGRELWVMPYPSNDQDILVRYYRHPAVMEDSESIPEGIPLHLQQYVLV